MGGDGNARRSDGNQSTPPPPPRSSWTKFLESLVCGGGAGAVAKTAVAPLSRVKVLFQVSPVGRTAADGARSAARANPTIAGTLVQIYQTQGIAAFWRGNGANMVRIVPNAAIKFASYGLFHDWMEAALPPPSDPGSSDSWAAARTLVAGGMSGATTVVLTFPLILARTRLTADTSAPGSRPYTGLADLIVQTTRAGGVRALFRGVGAGVAQMFVCMSITFTTYDQIKGLVERSALARGRGGGGDEGGETGLGARLAITAGGAVAGMLGGAAAFPLDTISNRMQVGGGPGNHRVYTGLVQCATAVVREEGFRALYRGLLASTIRAAPSAGIQFFVYDALSRAFVRWSNRRSAAS